MSQVAVAAAGVEQQWRIDAETPLVADAHLSTGSTVLRAEGDFDRNTSITGVAKLRRASVCPCPVWKRVMDIVGAATLLAALLPALVLVATFIKCVSRGPVLYRQRRYGLRGRAFRVWKFRTMEVSSDRGQHRSHVTNLMTKNGTLRKRDHELQIICGGRLMRKFGIDELPQLINVLKGEMSLVGPRPDVVPYRKYANRHRRRFDVLPGITGLWQVSGKNHTTFTTMMQLDLAYVRRRSIWLDVTILFFTIPALAWD